MLEDVDVIPLGFLYLYALADAGVEKVGTPSVFEDVDGLTGYSRSLVGLDDEETTHNKVFVDATFYGSVGIEDVADTINGERTKFDGDKYGGGGGKGVEGEDGEGRGAVDEDIVEEVFGIDGGLRGGLPGDKIAGNGGWLR